MSEQKAQALRDASAGWREMGRHLDEVVRGLDHGVGGARAGHWKGPAAEAFSEDWTRLKKSVDDALPVFELAAAGLDSAADRMELQSRPDDSGRHQEESADTARTQTSPDRDSGANAYNLVYALTALSHIGAALGSTFGKGRNGAGAQRGRTSLARSAPQNPSAAPRTADPFGPPETSAPAKEKPRGGLGIARGARSPAKGADGQPPREPASPGAGSTAPGRDGRTDRTTAPEQGPASGQQAGAAQHPATAPRPATAQQRTGAQQTAAAPQTTPPDGKPAPGDGGEPEQRRTPNTQRHGAFG
ncbi:WXG100 family type VII secretion target [Streptomyces sp. NPDC004647]|uniref:WXG100 family type VII secretion target n=1 Tax=Streptomyces sp. NPDC004647 TaxID=3154671 RepID=UPI0033AFB25A